MKRTSEDAFEATLECISQLNMGPVELLATILRALNRIKAENLIARKRGVDLNEVSHDIKTLTDSITYVKNLLSHKTHFGVSYEPFQEP